MGTGIVIGQITMQNISLIQFFYQSFKKLIAVSLTQVIKVEGVSKRMKKACLINVLDEAKQKNLKVSQ